MTEAPDPESAEDALYASLAHELKNPLNLITLSVELLTRQPDLADSPAVARAADAIRRSVHKQSQLIDEVSALSHARAGRLRPRGHPIDCAAGLRELLPQVEALAAARGVEWQAELPPQPVWVREEAGSLELTLSLLVRQVVKATARGGKVTLRLQAGDGTATATVGTDRGVAFSLALPLHEE
jgi:two-component system CheB/CheR fusion protein